MPTKIEISLDSSEYRKQLDLVVAQTRAARDKMAASISIPAVPQQDEIKVKADTTQAERKIQDVKKKIDDLPEKKDITVGTTGKDSGKTLTIPSENVWKKTSNGIRECWKEMTSLNGGARKFVSLIAGGGLIGVALGALQAVIKACVALYDNYIQKGKEAAQAHVEMASAIGEAAANNERLKASSNEVISLLSQLANVEKLSNAQKTQAIALIAQLTKQYGDLGVTVNEATGRIEGLSAAIVKKQEKDARRKISSLEAEIKELRNANKQENENVSNAGFNLGKINKGLNWLNPFGIISNLTGSTDQTNSALGLDQVQIGGEADAKEAAENIKKNTEEIQKKQLELGEQRKRLAEIEKKQLLDVQAETAALEAQRIEREKQSVYTKADNDLNRAKTAEEKIANRQGLIAGEKAQNDELHRKTDAAKAEMDRQAPGSLQYEDARKAWLQNLAEQEKSDAKIAGWNEQIKQIQYEQAEAKRKLAEQSAFELDYAKLIAAGEYDKAAALKQEYDLRQQNLTMSEKEKQTLLDRKKELQQISARKEIQAGEEELRIQRLILAGEYEKAQVLKLQAEARKQGRTLSDDELNQRLKQKRDAGSLSLAGSNLDKARDLQWQMMDKAGLGKQAAEQRALLDAEKTKGGKLTDAERESVSKLADLTWKMQNLPQMQMGDLSVKTNSLTSRGGFQGGAVLPDKDQVNKAISVSVKQTYDRLGDIKSFLDQLNISVRDSAKVNL